jgi:hypothetical protein
MREGESAGARSALPAVEERKILPLFSISKKLLLLYSKLYYKKKEKRKPNKINGLHKIAPPA